MNIFKMPLALMALAALSACGGTAHVSPRATLDNGASLQRATVSDGSGRESGLTHTNAPGYGDAYHYAEGLTMGREVGTALIPGVGTQITGGLVQTAVNRSTCNGPCGGGGDTTFVLQGGAAVANSGSASQSGTDVNIQTGCPNPRPDGSCAGLPGS